MITTNLKVGDKVRIVKKPPCGHLACAACHIGETRILCHNDSPNSYKIPFQVWSEDRKNWCSSILPEHLELLPEDWDS